MIIITSEFDGFGLRRYVKCMASHFFDKILKLFVESEDYAN